MQNYHLSHLHIFTKGSDTSWYSAINFRLIKHLSATQLHVPTRHTFWFQQLPVFLDVLAPFLGLDPKPVWQNRFGSKNKNHSVSTTRGEDPYHIDADPYADPDPTYHFDADPDPDLRWLDPNLQIKAQNYETAQIGSYSTHLAGVTRIRILPFNSRIHNTVTVLERYCCTECSGSMTFWCGSGSGDPCLCQMDPDPGPAIFVIDLQDASKKLIF
jgi:hypothetical protein